MQKFPRTTVGGVSVSRMIIGTNWFVGCSHTTEAKDQYINEHIKNRKAIADVIEVFVKAGVDTFMGQIQNAPLHDAVQLSLIHISEPTRRTPISYAVFCLKKK